MNTPSQSRLLGRKCIVATMLSIVVLSGCNSQPAAMQVERVAVDGPQKIESPEPPKATQSKTPPAPKRISDEEFRFAAHEGEIDVVRTAIDAGISVNVADPESSLTPLHMAAFNGHSEVVILLIAQGATIDARDHEGKTPLLHACTGPFAETVEILLAAGADVNAKESTEAFTPLMMAAGLGQPEVVEVLLKYKADKDVRDDDQDRAIDHARNSGHANIIKLLE